MDDPDNTLTEGRSHGGTISPLFKAVAKGLAGVGRWLLDAALPPLCLRCKVEISDPQSLCSRCWGQVRFLGPPQCMQCGLPFPHELGPGVKCGVCIARTPAFQWMRSAVAYDDGSRDLILGFKHADKLEIVPLFARWLKHAAEGEIAGCDMLIPVPLHWKRLVSRRYNQAALLAHGLGRRSSVPVRTGLLLRAKATVSQGEMHSARSRLRNVAGAFALSPQGKREIVGRRIVLVDDVLTTGATANACSKALLRGGAASVSVITLARVVRPLNFVG